MARTRIDAAVLIPGRGAPIHDGSVVLDGPTIAWVGATDEAPEVDGSFHVPTVLPGLWEAHGHFVGGTTPDVQAWVTEPTALKAARAAGDVTRTIMGGVTSVREVGGLGVYLARAVAEGSLVGPTIHGAGSILSTTGGHGDVHGLPLDWVTGLAESEAMTCRADGVPACLQAVRRQLRKGAAVIKVCASGGVMSTLDDPIHQQFSLDELRVIVEEAARADRVVAAHCHGKPGIMAALQAGVHTIEHGTWVDEEAATAMVEAGAMLVPTRFVIEEFLALDDLPEHVAREIHVIADTHLEAMRIAIAAGVRIAMGTDIFLSGATYGRNGREVRHLVDAGMTPLQAVEAATANGPDTLGPLAPRSGQLAVGFDADVIAIDGDPLTDPDLWGHPDRVTHVWRAGVAVKEPG